MRTHSVAPRYLVICAGTTGDVFPFMRVAKTLQELGREVTFITHVVHAGLLENSGLHHVGLGTPEDYFRVIRDPHIWHPTRSMAALLATYETQLLHLDAAIRASSPSHLTVAISHPLAVPGAAIARESGSVGKVVAVHLAPSSMRTCHDPMRLGNLTVPRWVPMRCRRALWRAVEGRLVDPVGIGQLNSARRALGLAPVRASLLAHIEEAPDVTVTLFPEWFGRPMPDWPRPLVSGDFQLFDAKATGGLDDQVSGFLAAGSKPFVFTPGTGNIQARQFFDAALASTTALARRAIFLTGERSQVPPELPPSILWRPWVSLSELLPHAAAIVHHGGIGTTAEALRAGTPQVVTPFAYDQFDNGARVRELGAGRAIPARRLGWCNLARALREISGSTVIVECCRRIAHNFTEPRDMHALWLGVEARALSGGDEQSSRDVSPSHFPAGPG